LFKRHTQASGDLGLPKEVAALMRGLWEAALSGADALMASRECAAKELEAQCLAEAAAARGELAGLQGQLAHAFNSLAVEQEKLSNANLRVEDLGRRLAERDSEVRMERSRSESLGHELLAHSERSAQEMAVERQARIDDLRAQREANDQELADLRAALLERSEQYSRDLKLAEDRMRAAERRLMLEQDAVRQTEAKAKETLAAERAGADARHLILSSQRDAAIERAAAADARLESSAKELDACRADAKMARSQLAEVAKEFARAAKPADASKEGQ
jgi:hypothetical protein